MIELRASFSPLLLSFAHYEPYIEQSQLFLQEIFVLLTSQTPQEGICQPKKSHKVSKILPAFRRLDWHYLDDIDLFESPGLPWGLEPKNKFRATWTLKMNQVLSSEPYL